MKYSRMVLAAALSLGVFGVWRTAVAQDLSMAEMAAASELSQRISTAEWLGPLAPVALSPFFGIACLSGLSLYGGDWVSGHNALLESSVLKSPALFWTFLILTVLTSVPRLTKLSKPFAQAIDQVEAYAGIITMLAVRFLPALLAGSPTEGQTAGLQTVMVQAGMFEVSADVLLAIAAGLNILVINAAKFFFEFLVWITPVPFLDACFEVTNKFVCASLMGLYAFSPTMATAFNLGLLVASLFVLKWSHRRVVFYRHMLFAPFMARLFGKSRQQHKAELIVFPQQEFGPFPEKARCILTPTDDGWKLTCPRWLRTPLEQHFPKETANPEIRTGWLTHNFILNADGTHPLVFSRGYDHAWNELPVLLNVTIVDVEQTDDGKDRKVEFA